MDASMKSIQSVTVLVLILSTFGISGLHLKSATASSFTLTQASPSTGASTVQGKIAFRRKTLHTMQDELEQVAASVKAERFGEAQATFEKALKKWYTFGGTVKRIAPNSYAKISPNFDAVKTGLYQSSVPLSTLKANLQTLIQDVKVAVPISDAKE
jgi:hypothetical protein